MIITDSPLHAPFHHCWLSFPSYSYLLELTAWEYHLSGLTTTITSRVWWPTLFTVFRCHKFPTQWLLSFLYTYFYSFIHNPDCAMCFILRYTVCMPSVLLHCWLGVSKSIWPVKIEWWGADVSVWCVYLSGVRCWLLAYGPADATASQNLIISCLIQIQTGFTFLVPAYPCCPGKVAVKRV